MIEIEVTGRTLLYFKNCKRCNRPFTLGDKAYRTNRRGYFCSECYQIVWRGGSEN